MISVNDLAEHRRVVLCDEALNVGREVLLGNLPRLRKLIEHRGFLRSQVPIAHREVSGVEQCTKLLLRRKKLCARLQKHWKRRASCVRQRGIKHWILWDHLENISSLVGIEVSIAGREINHRGCERDFWCELNLLALKTIKQSHAYDSVVGTGSINALTARVKHRPRCIEEKNSIVAAPMTKPQAPIRTLPFNSLPATTRMRFVEAVTGKSAQRPLVSQVTGGVGGGVGFLVLSAVIGVVFFAIFQQAARGGYSARWATGMSGLIFFSVALFLTIWSVVAAVRRFVLKAALPFPAGQFLFITDLVIANGDELVLVPMGRMKDFRGVHHHYNGGYTHTALSFTFEGWGTATFSVHGKHLADQILDELQALSKAMSAAVQAKDLRRVRELDVFYDAFASGDIDRPGALGLAALANESKDTGPKAGEVPKWFKFGWAVSLASGVAIALPAWVIASKAADSADLATALGSSSTYLVEDYLRNGDAIDEMRNEHMPVIIYREALRRNSVQSLRDFIRLNPNSRYTTEARGYIHATFVRVRARFDEQATTTNPQMTAFMTAMLQYLEEHDSPPVEVRFRPPTSDALTAMDSRLTQEGGRRLQGRDLVPIAPHFTQETAGPREREITTNLQRGFGEVFPNEVLTLQDGERILGASPSTVTNPTIEVGYEVRPSGEFYQLRQGNRAFVGINVDFTVVMRLPASTMTFSFPLSVAPPERFRFSYETNAGSSSGPSDGRVYSVMAERAFDRLSAQMGGVFFRSGTQAFQTLNAAAASDSN